MLKFDISKPEIKVTGKTVTNLETTKTEALVLLIQNTSKLSKEVSKLDKKLKGKISTVIKSGDFTGKKANKKISIIYTDKLISAERVILFGVGDKKIESKEIRNFGGLILSKLKTLDIKNFSVLMDVTSIKEELCNEIFAKNLTEGLLLASYKYAGFFTLDKKDEDKKDTKITKIELLTTDKKELKSLKLGSEAGTKLAEGVFVAKDLVNLPPNVCTPDFMAETAKGIVKETDLSVTILGEKELEKLKMGALLAVGRGSIEDSNLIIMEHNKAKAKEMDTVVLIGKGVTFDTGGYSLKPPQGMKGMKGDMGGGGAIIGAMKAIAKLDLPIHVVGLVPCAENKISNDAYLPDDVIVASNGITIEINSTDAEGRMLLADALVYAKRYDPKFVVDIATLTGLTFATLAGKMAGVFSTDKTLTKNLNNAATTAYERIWELPIDEEYTKPFKSKVADLINSEKGAGVSGATMFLKHFVDYPAWAHLDIAGMEGERREISYGPKGQASGFGVRLLAEFVDECCTKKK